MSTFGELGIRSVDWIVDQARRSEDLEERGGTDDLDPIDLPDGEQVVVAGDQIIGPSA